MGRLAIIGLLVCWMHQVPALGQNGESGLAFLRNGTNASAAAMGDAQVATSNDAFSTYWNPAGLAHATTNSMALSHHIWIADTRTYSLAGRFQMGSNGGIGVFVTALDSGDLDARDGPGPSTGVFDAQFISAGVAIGRSFGPVRVGVTAKFLSESIFENNSTGYAFDFGVQADFLQKALQVGAALQHVGEMNELNVVQTELPRTMRGGLAIFPFRILALNDGAELIKAYLTGEVSHVFPSETTRFHYGAAAEVVELVTLRIGYVHKDSLRGISAGGGIESNGFIFDYAVLPFDEGFGGPGHVLSLLYNGNLHSPHLF